MGLTVGPLTISAGGGGVVRVAGGTYKPGQDEAGNVMPGDREATLQLANGAEPCGGYAGLANAGFEPESSRCGSSSKNHSGRVR